MKLELNRHDLLPDFMDMTMSQVKFEHCDERSQRAIIEVGCAVIYEWDRSNYNVIYPPSPDTPVD